MDSKSAPWYRQHDNWREVISLLAGAGSGAVTKTATAPLERVKILFQVQGMGENTKYRGIWATCVQVAKESGLAGLYKGNLANVIRVIPVYGIKFASNDKFQRMMQTEGQPLTTTQLMAAGSMAGALQTTLTYPLDLIRTRLAMPDSFGGNYRGITHCAVQTVKTEGFSALYKGFLCTLASSTPYVGLQMTSYDLLKQAVKLDKNTDEKIAFTVKFSAGVVSSLFAQTVTFPGDTVRRRLQIQGLHGHAKLYSNAIDCCRQMWAKEGPMSFFQGLWANNLRTIPAAGIQFVSYEYIKAGLDHTVSRFTA